MFKTLIAFLLGGGSLAALGASSANAAAGVDDPLQKGFSWLTDWLPVSAPEDSDNHWLTRLLSNQGLTLAGTLVTSALLAVSGNPKLGSTALLAGAGISLFNHYRQDIQQQFASASGPTNGAKPGINLQTIPLEKSSYVKPASASADMLKAIAADPTQPGALGKSDVAAEEVMASASKEALVQDASARGTKAILENAKATIKGVGHDPSAVGQIEGQNIAFDEQGPYVAERDGNAPAPEEELNLDQE